MSSPSALVSYLIAVAALSLSLTPVLYAQPQIDTIYPTLGLLGEDLDVTVSGAGFDSSTRVSMYLDSGNANRRIGVIDTSTVSSVTLVENLAYVADTTGLRIVDISSLSNPLELSAVATGFVSDMVVDGSLAYLVSGKLFTVIDITNPTDPFIVSELPLSGFMRSLSVAGTSAYAVGESVMLSIDIADPSNPSEVASLALPGLLNDIKVRDGLAYVGGFPGFHIVDVSSPAVPSVLFEAGDNEPFNTVSITLEGERLYIAAVGWGLFIYDISNPLQPDRLAVINSLEWFWDAEIVGNLAYLSDGGLRIMDISDLSDPQDLGYIATGCYPRDIVIEGNIGFLGGCDVDIVDVSNPEPLVGIATIPGFTRDIVIENSIAYVASGNGLDIYDLSTPATPNLIGNYSSNVARALAIVGEVAYLLTFEGELLLIDISSLANPSLLGSMSLGVSNNVVHYELKADGNFVFIALYGQLRSNDFIGSLFVIDVSAPANPFIAQEYTATNGRGMDVSGSIVYIADESGRLQIVDASVPTDLRVLGSYDDASPSMVKIEVVGTRAYALSTNDLSILDITNPTDISLISATPLTGGQDLAVKGNRVYVSDLNDGVVVIDIANELAPVIVGNTRLIGWPYDLDILDAYAYVTGPSLSIVPLPVEISDVDFINSNKLALTLPSPKLAANYTIKAITSQGTAEELGGVTFTSELATFSQSDSGTGSAVPPPAANAVSKAIILAGGGPYPGNNLWPSTIKAADFAYRALLYQGYTRENIFYLSPDTGNDADGDGELNDVDASATTENLQHALLDWALDPEAPAYEMLIFIVDHGGASQFRLNETTILSSQQLDLWLDELQQSMPGKLLVVYDACQSGTFLPDLLPPADKERIVITSAGDENAFFINQGGLSFSFQFWTSILSGGAVLDSWIFGRNMMQKFQTAQLDADGDGIANEKADKEAVQELVIGRGYIPASDKPIISSVSAPQTLSGSLSATISASGIIDATGISRVWATISRPDFDPGDRDNPVLDYPEIELVDLQGDNNWVGIYDRFDVIGTYQITIHALNNNGFYSVPSDLFNNTTTVSQLVGLPGPELLDTDGDGYPDTLDPDDDNDGVPDADDVFPLLDSATGNLSSSEDPTYDSRSLSLKLPIVELAASGGSDQVQSTLYDTVTFGLASHCGPGVFVVSGGAEVADLSTLSDREITVSTYEPASGILTIPIIEITSEDVLGGPVVSRYANVKLSQYPECSEFAFRLVSAERMY